MSIFRRDLTLDALHARMERTLPGLLGIRLVALEGDTLRGTMPVDERHVQPAGILHGGASVVLSETLGSLAATLTLDEGRHAVGLEVNANHLAPARPGDLLTAECKPLHVGRTTQVWGIEIRRGDGRLTCISRLTVAVLDAPR